MRRRCCGLFLIACSDVGLKEEELQADGDGQLDGLKNG